MSEVSASLSPPLLLAALLDTALAGSSLSVSVSMFTIPPPFIPVPGVAALACADFGSREAAAAAAAPLFRFVKLVFILSPLALRDKFGEVDLLEPEPPPRERFEGL
jgi:hypothetical protein